MANYDEHVQFRVRIILIDKLPRRNWLSKKKVSCARNVAGSKPNCIGYFLSTKYCKISFSWLESSNRWIVLHHHNQ